MKHAELVEAYTTAEQLKQLISSDKRKADRVQVPLNVCYIRPETHTWSAPCLIEDISGSGIKFTDGLALKKTTPLTIKIEISSKEPPLVLEGEIMWCKKIPTGKNKKKAGFQKGIIFHTMKYEDRRKLIIFLSDTILATQLKTLTPRTLRKKRPAQRSTKR